MLIGYKISLSVFFVSVFFEQPKQNIELTQIKNKIVKKYKGKTEHTDSYIRENTEVKQPPVIPEGLVVRRKNPYLGEGYYSLSTNEEDCFDACVIDSEGNIIIPTVLFDISCFKNGMAPFKYGHRGIDGYLRKDGVIFDFSN